MATSENAGDPTRIQPEFEQKPSVQRFTKTERFVEIPDVTPANAEHGYTVRLEKLPDGRISIRPQFSDATVELEDLQEALDALDSMPPSDAAPAPVSEERTAGL